MAKKILVVDDSPTVRKELGNLFNREGFDVALAKNGLEALEWLDEVDFDLITLDINMPVMDGLTALKEIMKKKPTPVLMVSSLTTEDADITFEALEEGAVDFVPKPGTFSVDLKRNEAEILQKVKEALKIPKNRLYIKKRAIKRKVELHKKKSKPKVASSYDRVVLIGASTGGPRLIEAIAVNLPGDYPYPVCVVQHMPENFTAKFADRLNKMSDILVVEGKNSEKLESGKMIIAKGGYHLHFTKKVSGYAVKLASNRSGRFFVPSVDEMFFSAAEVIKDKKIMAVELTGIGDDGADGMVELRKKGAYTLAESEESAVVYGMPKEAFVRGGAMKSLNFEDILKEIIEFPKKDFDSLIRGN